MFKANGLEFSSYSEAAQHAAGGVIEQLDLPCFILAGLDEDDCLTVLAHWHYNPNPDEIDAMIATAQGEYISFNVSEVQRTFPGELSS